jgi:hypothetical protein
VAHRSPLMAPAHAGCLCHTSGLALSKDSLRLADMRVYGDEERH